MKQNIIVFIENDLDSQIKGLFDEILTLYKGLFYFSLRKIQTLTSDVF